MDDPRYDAYAHLILCGQWNRASRINLDPDVPICGETADPHARGREPARYRQVCILPQGHRDRWDMELDLLTQPASDVDCHNVWHEGWQITPLTEDQQLDRGRWPKRDLPRLGWGW